MTLHQRLSHMLGRLNVSPDHPVWASSMDRMGQHISDRLGVITATGQPIDEYYVARLESYMPKPRKEKLL